MTQPAKVQEPSMEEILASIRRIIADDEASPPSGEKPSSPAVQAKPEKPAAVAPIKAPAMNDIRPPSATAVAQTSAAKAAAPAPIKAAPPPAAPPAAPANPNNQDDIDALLAGLDEATSPEEIRPPAPEPEVFELTDDMAVPVPAKASFHRVDPPDDLVFVEAHTARAAHRQAAFEPRAESNPDPVPPILSRSTVSAVESAFNSLAHTVLSNNARTLEDLVKEMLRPMLKSWLDDNLPGMVERIVKMEIERVSRGRQ
jgi:cell pole-organizing protein PopZ